MRLLGVSIAILLANALDLGASLCLHGADQEQALPLKPSWLEYLQLTLLLPLVVLIIRYAPLAIPVLRDLAAPLSVRCAIALVITIQLGHVFLRTEHYPFSAVTMFSDYLPVAEPARMRAHSLFVVDSGDGFTPISFLREGNPLFSRYLGVDYKAGWILGTFGQDTPDNAQRVAVMLERAGGRNPRLASVELDPRSGRVQLRLPQITGLAQR